MSGGNQKTRQLFSLHTFGAVPNMWRSARHAQSSFTRPNARRRCRTEMSYRDENTRA